MKRASFALVVPSCLLVACSSVNPVTMLRVSQLSPLDADPAVLAIRLDLPAGINVPQGSAEIAFFSNREDTGEAIEESFVLEVQNGSTYRIAQADLERLRAAQATIKTWEAEAPEANTGGISVGVGACIIGDGPAPDARASVRVQLDDSGTFFPLISNAPLSAVLGDEELGELPQCEGPV